jgi:hypothetical protein
LRVENPARGYAHVTSPTDGHRLVLPAGQASVVLDVEVSYATNRTTPQAVALVVQGDMRGLLLRATPLTTPTAQEIARKGQVGAAAEQVVETAGTHALIGGLMQVVATQPLRLTLERAPGASSGEARTVTVTYVAGDEAGGK